MKKIVLASMMLGAILLSCNEDKRTVKFPKPVDTTNKPTTFPERGVYELEKLGVTISNDFDGARLNLVKYKNDSTLTAYIEPENEPINNSAYYGFEIWGKDAKKIYVELTYPEEFNHRYIPKIKRTDSDWTKMDTTLIQVDEERTTAIFPINITDKPTRIAAQPIVSSTDTKNWYTQLVKGNESFIKLLSVGKSVQGRDLPVLDITEGSTKGKDIVVFLTRQHPPETTGFLAYQKFMETIVKEHSTNPDFLKNYRVLSFPILNPDGVDLGNWRHNVHGVDLNRDWSMYRQPEVRQVVDYILDQEQKDKARIVLGIDFHSTKKDVFYTNKGVSGMILPNFVNDWFEALEANISDYKVNNRPSNVGKPVSKGWFLQKHNCVGITYEMGDDTAPARIQEIASEAAKQAIKILMKEKQN